MMAEHEQQPQAGGADRVLTTGRPVEQYVPGEPPRHCEYG